MDIKKNLHKSMIGALKNSVFRTIMYTPKNLEKSKGSKIFKKYTKVFTGRFGNL